MIDLRKTLTVATRCFRDGNIPFALIGGFALSVHGVHRATSDIDILIDGSRKDDAKEGLIKAGFSIRFESPEVLQFDGPGFLDLLLANRPLSLEMLEESSADPTLGINVVSPEGIIGLKIQAYSNDPGRRLQDLADIQSLLKNNQVDLNKVKSYADLFDQWETIKNLETNDESQ